MRSLACLAAAVCIGVVALPMRTAAQVTGSITGVVVDAATGKPLPYASVAIMGTPSGANAKRDGTFTIRSVQPGQYSLRASYIGYEAHAKTALVEPNGLVQLRFELVQMDAVGSTDKIIVKAERALVDVSEISSVRTQGSEDIAKLAVDEIADVVARQVGVSGEAQELHIRGGRSDETLFRIENVAMKNTLTGAAIGGVLSAKAVERLEVITGGYEAEYGQAISGIVNVRLKEPGTRRLTSTEYHSGSFDTERVYLQTEGRLAQRRNYPVFGKVSYLLSVDMLATDTYLPSRRNATDPHLGQRRTLRSRYDNSFAGLQWAYDDFLRWRQENSVNLIAKTTWRVSSRNKVNATYTKFVSMDHGFSRFRVGDESQDAASSTGRYNWAFRDQFDQFPTNTEETNRISVDWRHTIGAGAYATLTLARVFNQLEQSVQGKRPWVPGEEYKEWRPPASEQFFITDENNDFPFYEALTDEHYTVATQYTQRWRAHHEFKAGIEGSYYNLQMISIRNPALEAGLGNVRDLYEVHPNDGAFFAQNSFSYEGFVGHAGLRGDYQFLGEAADKAAARAAASQEVGGEEYFTDSYALFGRRYKLFWSPRLAINHPITDRASMHFNFGHFVQWPRKIYYFAKIGSRSSEAFPLEGNLNLDPERSVQFEFGVKQQFSEHDAFDITIFNKDTYDYPTATQPIEATRNRLVYVNSDFSRTRGIEFVYQRQGGRRISSQVSYEFQIATGKPADPNRIRRADPEALEVGEAEPELNEEFMPWNRPHRVQGSLDLRFRKDDRPHFWGLTLPDQWGVNLFYTRRSGRPYTPTSVRGEPTAKRNSENAPFEDQLDFKLDKFWERSAGRFGVALEVRNVLGARNLRRVDSVTGGVPEVGRGRYRVGTPDTRCPDPETGDDPCRRAQEAELRNPAFYAEGRNLRLGLEVTF